MKIKFGLVLLFGAISLILHAQESTDLDSVVVRTIDVYLEYCTSTNSAIEHAIEIGIPIARPSLAINRVVIIDEKEIDIIRNCFHGKWLGPYRISKKKRYSAVKAEKMGFYGVSRDGLVAISLKRNEIFDINCLESWLKDMIKNNPQYLKESIDNSQILTTQVHYFSDVPKDLVDNLGKMGMDNSSILNDQEGQYLNFIFKTEAQGINLAGKKVAFLGSKVDYFESTRKDSLVVGGSNLYLFNTMQKTESGGYDAAVTYWKKFVIPTQEIVRTIKDNTKE